MDKLSSDDFKIIFVATGGVERLVIQQFENLPRPAILLADGMQNSLAAALEIITTKLVHILIIDELYGIIFFNFA